MAKNKSIITRVQHWMDSVSGQTFMNYAYSWGAAVVILGALLKLLHAAGANYWLIAGMGTEVFVFIISGFDRSGIDFEKAKRLEAKRRAKEQAEGEADVVETVSAEAGTALSEEAVAALAAAAAAGVAGGGSAAPVVIGGGGVPAGGAPVIIGGGMPVEGGEAVAVSGEAVVAAGGAQGPIVIGGGGGIQPVQPVSVDDTERYVNTLKELTETLIKVNEQASRLTRDSEEMQNLGRTLTGINVIYEQQLKQVSAQMGSMDEINVQTQQMAAHIAELNALYARMIQAMTVNMPAGAQTAAQQ